MYLRTFEYYIYMYICICTYIYNIYIQIIINFETEKIASPLTFYLCKMQRYIFFLIYYFLSAGTNSMGTSVTWKILVRWISAFALARIRTSSRMCVYVNFDDLTRSWKFDKRVVKTQIKFCIDSSSRHLHPYNTNVRQVFDWKIIQYVVY